jgi:hypothetical protein
LALVFHPKPKTWRLTPFKKPVKSKPRRHPACASAFAALDQALAKNTRSSALTRQESLRLVRLRLFGHIAEESETNLKLQRGDRNAESGCIH